MRCILLTIYIAELKDGTRLVFGNKEEHAVPTLEKAVAKAHELGKVAGLEGYIIRHLYEG